jgi:subtilisin-like proprotein convertase family protein
VPIPDADFDGATVPITVSGIGPLSKATFSVDGTVCTTAEGATTVGIDHTFVNDLIGFLTSPDGTQIAVFAFILSDGNNICQAVFDDSAARSIDDATEDEAPFTGSWRPTEPMSSFTGEDADGTWLFNAIDVASPDTGSIRAVSLHLSGFVTPGP